VPDALGHLVPERARHEHERLVGLQIVEVRAALAADLEEVAEPLGRDETRRDAAVLDQGVGGHGRAVAEVADRRRRVTRRFAQPFDHAEYDRARRVVRRARHLPDTNVAARLIDEADVRERATRIDPDAPHPVRSPLGLSPSSVASSARGTSFLPNHRVRSTVEMRYPSRRYRGRGERLPHGIRPCARQAERASMYPRA
jgi:hypothetical protein